MRRLYYLTLGILSAAGLVGLGIRLAEGLRVTNLTSAISWGLWVALYIYFIGLSAGSFLLSTMVYVFGMHRFERVGRVALLSAFFALGGALVFIWLDLGHPWRFWHPFAYPHFGSVMAVEIWLYLVYICLIVVELWLLMREDLGRMATGSDGSRRLVARVLALGYRPPEDAHALSQDRRRVRHWVRLLGMVGVPIAIGVHGGTGGIFGVVGARSYWFGGIFPIIFLVSALASGAALVTFVYALFGDRVERDYFGLLRRLGELMVLFIAIDLLLLLSEILSGMYGGETEQRLGWHSVLFGRYWFVFWLGQVGMAGVFAIALVWKGVQRRSRLLIGAAGASTVLGVVAIRLNIVIPAFIVPELPGLDRAYQSPRLAFTYFPSGLEWLTSVGMVALGLLLFSLALEHLPVIEYVGHRYLPIAGGAPTGSEIAAPGEPGAEEPRGAKGPGSLEPPQEGLSRRELLKGGAFLGSTLALAGAGIATARTIHGFPPYLSPEIPYGPSKPENVIYTTCLQCQVRCALKAKFHDGALVKIDGNPFSAKQVLPSVPYDTPLDVAAAIDGKLCPKGQAGVQTYADPYRLRKVLKRVGPRGGGRWRTIPFDQAIREIVQGGDLFGEGPVEGLKSIRALTDPDVAAALAADVELVRSKEMSVEEFKRKHAAHLDLLIDPDHPDLGPKNNQFVFLAGRINRTRVDLAKRFVTDAFGSVNLQPHTSICELSIFVNTAEMTRDFVTGSTSKHFMPDFLNSEFVIFWGTGFAEANFGLTPMAELVTRAMTEGALKVAVIDPRLSKSAAKAWRWVPIQPGRDAALALGMIRWIIENARYDRRYLENPNLSAAAADGETTSTDATHLVRTDTMQLLRAEEIGLHVPPPPPPPAPEPGRPVPPTLAPPSYFVVMTPDGPMRHDLAEEGTLEVDTTIRGIPVKSVFTLLKERALERTLAEYAEIAGVTVDTIVELANEFTSHGKRAAIDVYRGAAKHPGGFYAMQAINTLNVLIGNQDWKGGLVDAGGSWDDLSEKYPHPFVFDRMSPGKLPAFGIKISREGVAYESTTLFESDGYPAERPWYPFGFEMYHDVIPAAEAGYPYPVKALWLHMGTPGYSVPGGAEQIRILRDPSKVPLFIATDIVIGETSMYADYIFPDLTYLERWASPGDVIQPAFKKSPIRQPAAAPIPETVVVFGEEMPISMEAVMLAIAEQMHLPLFGPEGFGPGRDLKRPEDFYLKVVANLAWGDSEDGSDADAVPEADEAELEIFRAARRHLPPSVFDEAKWRRAVADERLWRRVVYVLNRGGRFGSLQDGYAGDHPSHTFGGTWHLYLERVAAARDSISGRPFDGLPRWDPPVASDGSSLDDPGYPFSLITYKESFGTQSRTAGNYWSQNSLAPENFVLMAAADAERLGLRDGDVVRLASRTLPDGVLDLGDGRRRPIEGRVRIVQGLRPGVLAVSHHFGHWAYGSNDVVVDDELVPGDPRRGRGLPVNALLRLDDHMRTGPVTDPIGGSVSFNDTKVKLLIP